MNNIKAVVTNIQSSDELNIVEFDFNGTTLSMMALELPSQIKVGTQVILGAKPSHITIAKDKNIEISYSNKLETKIIDLIQGELLCNIIMCTGETKIESLITKKTMLKMQLKKNDQVITLIKSSELFIKEVMNV
ncbi:MAG: transporter [Campylobacteraceae bacterium]|nr:transporter [Campylobacteraceae bacterium]